MFNVLIYTFSCKCCTSRLRNYTVQHQAAYYGAGSDPIWLDDVYCTGAETSIFNCSHQPIGSHNCGHGEDVGIDCNPSMFFLVFLLNAVYNIN